MRVLLWLKQLCEYLGGERNDRPVGFPFDVGSPFWGLWWGILVCLILIFSGQASKFIYIDF